MTEQGRRLEMAQKRLQKESDNVGSQLSSVHSEMKKCLQKSIGKVEQMEFEKLRMSLKGIQKFDVKVLQENLMAQINNLKSKLMELYS